MKKQAPKPKNWIRYYDDRNILDEMTDESVDLVLDEYLRDEILSGKRKRKLKITARHGLPVVIIASLTSS